MEDNKVETWEERRAREKAEEKRKALKIRAKIAAVAKLLGMKLEPEKDKEGGPYPSGSIKAADGSGYWLRAETYGRDAYKKLRVSGDYPRDSKGQYVEIYEYDEKHNRVNAPAVSVSVEKSAEQIAKDIRRRLEPGYLARLAKVREKVANTNDYEVRTLAALTALKGSELDNYERERHAVTVHGCNFGGDYASRACIKASREDITLEIHNIPEDVAAKILNILR